MRVLTVVGARPQFIKAVLISKSLRSKEGVREVLLHTGQHYDAEMSNIFFEQLNIPEPDYYLGIGGGTHGQNTGRMIEAIEEILLKEHPDWVLVYGDTDSTLAGALAAVKLHIPVAHVEAGLRSFNRHMPEEINRVLTDHAADLLFAPTPTAVENLRQEGLPESRVRWVGDVMYDAALHFGRLADRVSTVLKRLDLESRGYVLATVHRAENTDEPARLKAVFEGLSQVAAELPVVLPLHPRTRKALERLGWLERARERLRLIEPVGYLDMMALEKNARLIATDSGGVQKEAYFFGVPCVTLRDETEWVELVEAGWNFLAPPHDAETVARLILSNLNAHGRPIKAYGDGHAVERIVSELIRQ
ncbi:MAG: UDP-N-acetylglucosamine 2-epimerase (non-hydrolyzing) [Gammaproteobacteria bacterium]|nr:UDP-N-acetylglucosamine 2-epimerase (non-hydrolyzing) [Gammaproteobacteria bacterium]